MCQEIQRKHYELNYVKIVTMTGVRVSSKYQGSAAIHFKTCPAINDFICNKNSLPSSEWTAAIKLNSNYANLNGAPGFQNTSTHCRKCNKETESIAHVTGCCSLNSQLITARHHNSKNQIAQLLTDKEFECFQEVYAVDTDGRSRFCDIVAFQPKSNKAFILDPTIRYEVNDIEQDKMICKEKADIYEKCIPFLNEKYATKFGIREWTVHGLWFGSRGTVGDSVMNFFRDFKLPLSALKEISEEILVRTIHIIHQHIYN